MTISAPLRQLMYQTRRSVFPCKRITDLKVTPLYENATEWGTLVQLHSISQISRRYGSKFKQF